LKGLVYLGPNQISWQEWPEPQIGSHDALVAVRAVGICGSDVHGFTGESGRRTPPMVMGHEAAGEVIAIGEDVDKHWVGKPVVVCPFIACGECDFCEQNRGNLCRHRKFVGATLSGAMVERIAVPIENLISLPDGIDPIHASLAEPLSVARHAVHQSGEINGKTVLIAGSGPIGLLTLVAAKKEGAKTVVITDLAPDRLVAAENLGADLAINPGQAKWRDELGISEVDIAFDAVGIQPTFDQAFDALRPGGTMVAIGGWKKLELNLPRLVAKEINLVGTFNFTLAEFKASLDWISNGVFDPAKIVTNIFPMENGESVFHQLASNELSSIKTVLTN